MGLQFRSSILELSSVPDWDEMVTNGVGGTVFHEAWYLRIMGVKYVIGVFAGERLVAGMPLYGSLEQGVLFQSTISVPYSGPVIKADFSKGRHAMRLKRDILEVIIEILKERFQSICFATSPDIIDIVPFIRNGFIPEVRYTYINHLMNGMDHINSLLASGRRKDLTLGRKKGIQVLVDEQLKFFSIPEALFWTDSEAALVKATSIIQESIKNDRGKAIVATDEAGNRLGGLFLTWDARSTYTIYSYFNHHWSAYGVPTALYIEAMRFTKERLDIDYLDFEGSVLLGVEEYYQSFGATQTLYFNLHWDIDRQNLLGRELYVYE